MTNTQLITANHKDMTIREISETFKIRKECICAVLSQKGLKAKPGRVVIDENTTWQVKKLAPTHTIAEITNLLGLSKWQINKIISAENIATRGYGIKDAANNDNGMFNIDNWKDDKIFI